MKRNAFTFIEVLIAVVILGIAIVSMLTANLTYTKANDFGTKLSTAEFLIEQIKELTTTLPVIDPETGYSTFGPEEAAPSDYDDLDDFDNLSLSPPINADRQSLTNFPQFTQHIEVQNVHPNNFEQIVSDHSSNFVRVKVTIYVNSEIISSTSWIRARY